MGTILSVKGLKKYFDTKHGLLHAVDGVTFDLEEGKTLGVVGESGCGKSTLGRALIHLLTPTDGQIIFKGKDISTVSKKQTKELRKEMPMIFQDPFSSINPRKTVSSTIGEPLKIYKKCRTKAELQEKVKELMDTVGLAERTTYSYPHELDGGRRQRIGIARALALDPKLIVCDEPVSALDVSIQAQILNLMMDLQEKNGITYIFITHDLSVVKHISDDILVMYLGMMAEKSPTNDLFRNPLHPYTKALLSAIPVAKYRENKHERIILKGEITSPINPDEGCRFAPRCQYAKDICSSKTPHMEEVLPGHHVSCHLVREINQLDDDNQVKPMKNAAI